MNARDRTRLLFGPYRQPGLRKGDRAFCCFKDAAVVVTGLGYAMGGPPRGRPYQ